MSDVKRAIRGIPPKQAKEEAASDKQIGYLRSFGYFPEKLIINLGMWQASYLIDKAIRIKESEDDEEPRQKLRGRTKQSQKSGCGNLLMLFVAIAVVIFLIQICGHKKSGTDKPSSTRLETTPKNPKLPKLPESKLPSLNDHVTPSDETSPVSPEKPTDPPRLVLATFEGESLPVTVVVIEPFSLLDETGKETPMAVGSVIRVNSRTERGTLTMEINGASFVGNESRLANKVKKR